MYVVGISIVVIVVSPFFEYWRRSKVARRALTVLRASPYKDVPDAVEVEVVDDTRSTRNSIFASRCAPE
jgi:hypothetical protein